MLYPQKGIIAIGSLRGTPTLPVAAAVVSLTMVAPTKTPCCQLNASKTSGAALARRPPKMMAEMGTPRGSSISGPTLGHCLAGTVKRLFGCAALSLEPRAQGLPCQSVARSGGSPSAPSHQGSPPSVSAVLV